MSHRGIILLTILGTALVAVPGLIRAQQPDVEQQVLEAKALYRDGSFAEAIVKLQDAVSRLQLLRGIETKRMQLAEAYLHMSLSYFALDNRAAAKETLKGLLRVDRERRLDPQIYAPPVIALFEEARAEVAKEPATAAAAPAPVSSPHAAPAKKGGSKGPLIALVAGAAAGGVALAAKGGGSSMVATPAATPTATPTATPAPTVSGSDDIAFQGSNPAPGSSLPANSFRLLLLFTVVSANELRNHVLHVDLGGPLNPPHSNLTCVSGYSQPFTVSPGQSAQVAAMVGFDGQRAAVCRLPLTLTSVAAFLERGVDQHDFLLRRDFTLSYTILP